MIDEEKIEVANSSNIKSYAYSPKSRVLTIEFQNWGAWQYDSVPQALFDDMKKAESKGGFFNKYVRGHFIGRPIK